MARVRSSSRSTRPATTTASRSWSSPPPGAHVYLAAFSYQWLPILKLQKGVEYTLHLSSLDVNHGFSLYPINVNFQVVPGYDYGLRITPNASGDFRIICNEFCGIGHHTMVGRVIVEDGPVTTTAIRRRRMTPASGTAEAARPDGIARFHALPHLPRHGADPSTSGPSA
jgi:heme/copper-type cytochrome/quinol oxidase subunit 2